ncbi:MAG: hypothetical protein DMG57_32685 [Acidobacteria bacterium]|nr:MAG: hypothetical protein DMG57_32685 [Acidobacteriota bacterium]
MPGGTVEKSSPARFTTPCPIVKKLGFTWVTLDDGWQTAQGDWFLQPQKFPNGDADMRVLVDKIHAEGFKAQLWWAAAGCGSGYGVGQEASGLAAAERGWQQAEDFLLEFLVSLPGRSRRHRIPQSDRGESPQGLGFRRLKLDGQHMNGAPPCYNPAHKHARPEESVEGMPKFFQALYDTARQAKPDALIEFCPCGTAYSFFTLPFLNMSVASDPESAWQVRTKGKTLKALQGDSVA